MEKWRLCTCARGGEISCSFGRVKQPRPRALESLQLPQSLPHVTTKLPRSTTQVRPQEVHDPAWVRHMASELSPTALRPIGEITVQMDPWRNRRRASDSTTPHS